ncbi:MAG: ArsR family transcriptional regulator [Candidatus Thorarchaeota archaeon]|nr:ArsR family transcriptional regulator [Candidatus Thorarchaeota archaeon]
MDDVVAVSKALSNPTRIKILNYLLSKRIANKGDIMDEMKLERAALEHHLKSLIDAGIVGTFDVLIDKVKNSLCFPLVSVSISKQPEIPESVIRGVIGAEIESDVNHDEIQEKAQREVEAGRLEQEDAVAIVRTLFAHRGRGTKNLCVGCGRIKKMSDLSLCDKCFRPVCSKCEHVIQREDKTSELLCDRCLSLMFGL